MNRVGLQFGNLTIIAESRYAIRCRCKCGADDWYPSAITKPTYQHRRMCARCAGSPCEVCGKWINAKPGRQSPTCSLACRKRRSSDLELIRYHSIKHTEHWREVRRKYIEQIKLRITDDPAFALIYRAFQRKRGRDYAARINSDPAKRDKLLNAKRVKGAAWRAKLRECPDAYLAHLQSARGWYASLSPTDKERIYKSRM